MTNKDFISPRFSKMEDLGLSFNKARTFAFPPPEFRATLASEFVFMDEAQADFMEFFDDYLQLEDQLKLKKIEYTAETSEAFAEVHDKLLCATDRILLFYAFLLKNFGILPAAIRAIKGDVEPELNMHLTPFSTQKHIASEWHAQVRDSYDALNEIRSYFTREVSEQRKSSWKDDFSQTFLDGAEMPRERIFDRIEFLFFEKYGIPLGVFDVSDEVADYIAQDTARELYTINLAKDIRDGALAQYFPGLTLYSPSEDAPKIKTKLVIKANSQNVNGMITHPRLIFKPRSGFF
jgi:hypothetical protein